MNPPKDLKTPTNRWGFLFTIIFCIFNNMKKYILILTVGVTLTLMSCGSESATNETSDSSVVSVDTVSAPVDTTAVQPVDGSGSGVKNEIPVK